MTLGLATGPELGVPCVKPLSKLISISSLRTVLGIRLGVVVCIRD